MLLTPTFTSLLLAGAISAPAPTAADSNGIYCALYRSALSAVVGDAVPLVLVDSTGEEVPSFALAAYTARRTLAEQGLESADSVLEALDEANARRESIARCFSDPSSYVLVTTESLLLTFKGDNGWRDFQARHSDATGFLLLSRPAVSSDSSTAFLYVARAAGWLSGFGVLVRLERDANGHWMKQAQYEMWVS